MQDAKLIRDLSVHLDYKELAGDIPDNNLERILASDSNRLWVFDRENEILGWLHAFIALRIASPQCIEIGGMVVSSAHRRSGVGKQLVRAAADWANEQNLMIRVRCNLTRKDAHRFYESLGFILTKEQTVFEMQL